MLHLKGNIWVSIYKCRSERIAGRPLCLDGSSPTVPKNFLQNVISITPLKLYCGQEGSNE